MEKTKAKQAAGYLRWKSQARSELRIRGLSIAGTQTAFKTMVLAGISRGWRGIHTAEKGAQIKSSGAPKFRCQTAKESEKEQLVT